MKRFLALSLLFFSFVVGHANENEIVVALHGFMSNNQSMVAVKNTLVSSNTNVYLWEYPSKDRAFEEHGRILADFLKQLADCNPGTVINFVAHSSSSLILRSALNMPHCPEEAKIGRAVLFAPPNKGSKLARRFRTFLPVACALGKKSGRQLMSFESNEIIQCFGSFPASMEILVIAGNRGSRFLFKEPNDGFISVEETYLESPHYFLCFPVKHGSLLKHPPALHAMRDFLRLR